MSLDSFGVRSKGGLILRRSLDAQEVMHHLMVHGQSLSVGFSANGPIGGTQVPVAPITTTALLPDRVRMFNTGARARQDGLNEFPLNPSTITSLVGLKEQAGPGGLGETICSGAAYWLADKLQSQQLMATTHGRSEYRIDQLKLGTQPFANGVTAMQRAAALAAANNLLYHVPALLWLQGEADENFNTEAAYIAQLTQLRADYQAATESAGSTPPVGGFPLFFYQFSTFWWVAYTGAIFGQPVVPPEMPAVLLDAHLSSNLLRLVTPTYIFPHNNNGVHMEPQGYRHLGEYFARALYEQVYLGNIWECLRPVVVNVSGVNTIDVQFTGNEGALVFDTVLVDDPGSFGFIVTDGPGGAEVPIMGVTLLNANTVRLTLNGLAAANVSQVRYAWPVTWPDSRYGTDIRGAGPVNGIRGNVRDSNAPASVFGHAPLFKWAASFVRTAT